MTTTVPACPIAARPIDGTETDDAGRRRGVRHDSRRSQRAHASSVLPRHRGVRTLVRTRRLPRPRRARPSRAPPIPRVPPDTRTRAADHRSQGGSRARIRPVPPAHRRPRTRRRGGAACAGRRAASPAGPASRRRRRVARRRGHDGFARSTTRSRRPRARRDLAMLELLYGAGLRVSECCGLDVGDVDLKARTVTVLGKGSRSVVCRSANRRRGPCPTTSAGRQRTRRRPHRSRCS